MSDAPRERLQASHLRWGIWQGYTFFLPLPNIVMQRLKKLGKKKNEFKMEMRVKSSKFTGGMLL